MLIPLHQFQQKHHHHQTSAKLNYLINDIRPNNEDNQSSNQYQQQQQQQQNLNKKDTDQSLSITNNSHHNNRNTFQLNDSSSLSNQLNKDLFEPCKIQNREPFDYKESMILNKHFNNGNIQNNINGSGYYEGANLTSRNTNRRENNFNSKEANRSQYTNTYRDTKSSSFQSRSSHDRHPHSSRAYSPPNRSANNEKSSLNENRYVREKHSNERDKDYNNNKNRNFNRHEQPREKSTEKKSSISINKYDNSIIKDTENGKI